jgi:hypothetical protein
VEHDGKGLGHGEFGDRGAGCRDALDRIADENLAESALDMGHRHGAAIEAHVEALVRQAAQAEAAMPAGAARVHGDAVARFHACHVRRHFGDRAGDLMAEDHRLAHAHGAEAAMVVIMQVGAADAARLDAHGDLAGAERLDGALLDPQIFRRVDHDRAHGKRPYSILQSTGLQSTGVSSFWPAKWAARLSRTSCPMARRVSTVALP